jgi:hypothetical protein
MGLKQLRRTGHLHSLMLSLMLAASGIATGSAQTELGTFMTIDVPNAVTTVATDINARGEIVGAWDDSTGTRHGFRLRRGVFTTIEFPEAILTNAAAINAAGDIAGRYTSADGVRHGFLLSHGAFTTIDFPDATRTRVSGISARGAITGDHCAATPVMPACLFQSVGNVHGFLLNRHGSWTIDVPDSTYTEAWRSNAAGEIVGRYKSADGHSHVYLRHTHGGFESVDFPEAIETAFGNFTDDGGINDRGDIVSNYCDAAPCPITPMDSAGNVHGFLLRHAERDEDDRPTFVSFDVPGALNTTPYGINDRREIVGAYVDVNGVIHGFLLSRRDDR